MTDMEAINKEAHRLCKDHICGNNAIHYAERFANTRDQLIKEGWTPTPDVAAELYDAVMLHDRDYSITLIRGALFKARAHPAEVVDAAKVMKANFRIGSDCLVVADYILNDV